MKTVLVEDSQRCIGSKKTYKIILSCKKKSYYQIMRSLPPDGGVAGIDAEPPDNNDTENEQQQPLVQNCFACSKTEDLSLCPDCGLVYYCGPIHKEIHRPETTCFPFIVRTDEKLGR